MPFDIAARIVPFATRVSYLRAMNLLCSSRLRIVGITIVLFVISIGHSIAQCGMCKAVAENSLDDNGYGTAAGLNNGIVFLMGIPYVLLAILILVFFKKRFFGFWKEFSNIHSN